MNKTISLLFALIVSFTLATSAKADTVQNQDPRIGQKERLALIDMDPVDINYRTNNETHKTGVLLVPSSGPIMGKKGWYTGLAVPAGTLVDVPTNSLVEPYTFTAPNGESINAVKVTLAPGAKATINACGNDHKPKEPMIMKMIDPVIEVRVKETVKVQEVVKEVPAAIPTNLATRDDLAKMFAELKDADKKEGGESLSKGQSFAIGFAVGAVIFEGIELVLTKGKAGPIVKTIPKTP